MLTMWCVPFYSVYLRCYLYIFPSLRTRMCSVGS